MFSDFLNSKISSLDFNWFIRKQDFFSKETFFSNIKGKIYEELSEYYYDEENDETASSITTIDIDLNAYCWDSNYPNCISDDGGSKCLDLPVDSRSLARHLITYIELYLKGNNDLDSKYKFILLVISEVTERIRENIEIAQYEVSKDKKNTQLKYKFEEYQEVVNDFLLRFKKELSTFYGAESKAHKIKNDYEEFDRIDFNLNQNELGALLYILTESNFIRQEMPNDNRFLNFCEDRFYFKNQKSRAYTKSIDIKDRFGLARADSAARRKIKEKLLQTLRGL